MSLHFSAKCSRQLEHGAWVEYVGKALCAHNWCLILGQASGELLPAGPYCAHVDLQEWAALVQRMMEQDWSWSEPALDYIELYYKAIKR